MNLYYCNGFRSVRAQGIGAAAEVFAARAARKRYGRSGYCRVLRMGSYSQDRTLVEYEAFIGYTTGLNETTGHNIHLTVQEVKGGVK